MTSNADDIQEGACRDCLSLFDLEPHQHRICPSCGSARLLVNSRLSELAIAHIDCDAFYASVEKRDNPLLRSKPLIIGGGSRGVVATACYIARLSGVRSAMPMFKARRLCPDAVVLRPDMTKYRQVSRDIRNRFDALSPLVEPLSLDEAFLDLTGTERLHHRPPVLSLLLLQEEIEREVGVSVSVGLAPNKFLAKLGSDMDKPRGFTVIGAEEAERTLAPLEIKRIMGVGTKSASSLARDGLTHIHQLQGMSEDALIRRYGETGLRLKRLAHGIDNRPVKADRKAKSVSAETTFPRDITTRADLEAALWRQCERTASDAKRKGLAGLTVTLKLKNHMHKTLTRSRTLDTPTQLAETLFEVGCALLAPLVGQHAYRLIGIGLSQFRPLSESDQPDLIDPQKTRRADAERTMDAIREKFGAAAVQKGRSFTPGKDGPRKSAKSASRPGKNDPSAH